MWECGCETNVAVSVRNETPNSSMDEIRRGENKKLSENDCVWDLGRKKSGDCSGGLRERQK